LANGGLASGGNFAKLQKFAASYLFVQNIVIFVW